MNTLHLAIGTTETTAVLSRPDGSEARWRLPIGLATLWPEAAHSGGPSALMIEHAIQTVEDQIERLAGHIPAGARLVVTAEAMAPLQRAGAIWGLAHEAIGLAQIEHEYQQLAARAVGAPQARGSGFDDPAGDALVLILRECLHHLGFDAVHLADTGLQSKRLLRCFALPCCCTVCGFAPCSHSDCKPVKARAPQGQRLSRGFHGIDLW